MDATPSGPDSSAKVCAVCARVLNRYQPPSGPAQWIHPFEPDVEDHPVVPVDRGEVITDSRCDFCSAPEPAFVLPVAPMDMPRVDSHLVQRSADDWACCAECARLIDAGQWSAVIRRASTATAAKLGVDRLPEDVQTALNRLYRAVRKHQVGATRPYEV